MKLRTFRPERAARFRGLSTLLALLSLGLVSTAELALAEASPSESTSPASGADPVGENQRTPSDEAEARDLFRRARESWEAQEYDAACRLFHESQARFGSAAALLNIGRCYEMQSDLAAAREAYRAALEAARAHTDPEKRRLWQSAALEALERLGPVESPADPGASEPAEPRPEVTQAPKPKPRVVENPPPPPPDAKAASFWERKSTPWIFVGGGAALGAGAVVTGLMALSQRSALESDCTLGAEGNGCPYDPAPKQDEIRALSTASDALWISGALLAAGGITLFIVQTNRPAPEVSLGCDGFGCRAALRTKF